MSILSKEEVIARLKSLFGADLHPVPRKQLFYSGKLANGKEILVCTPGSKLHPGGNGWTDLTTIQVSMLEQADYSILAFRVEGNVYYISFPVLRNYLTEEALTNNKNEGDHWKLHIWPDHIKVLGNDAIFYFEANNLDEIKNWV